MNKNKRNILILFTIIVVIPACVLLLLLRMNSNDFKTALSLLNKNQTLSFQDMADKYELKRISQSQDGVEIIHDVGNILINSKTITFDIDDTNEKYPWESDDGSHEYNGILFSDYNNCVNEFNIKNSDIIGFIEYRNLYYIVTEIQNSQFVYPISSVDLSQYTLQEFIVSVNNFVKSDPMLSISGGNGLKETSKH